MNNKYPKYHVCGRKPAYYVIKIVDADTVYETKYFPTYALANAYRREWMKQDKAKDQTNT
jgi:hypothetical protein